MTLNYVPSMVCNHPNVAHHKDQMATDLGTEMTDILPLIHLLFHTIPLPIPIVPLLVLFLLARVFASDGACLIRLTF